MSTTLASKASDINLAPMLVSTSARKVQTKAVTTTVAQQALFTGLTPTIAGKQYVTFGSVGGTTYIVFKKGTSAATATTSTAWPIGDGGERSWWIDFNDIDYCEVLTSTSTSTLYWYISSPSYDNPGGTF